VTDQPRWPEGTPIAPDGKGPGGGRFRDSVPEGWALQTALVLGQKQPWKRISRGELSLAVRRGTDAAAADKLHGGEMAQTQIFTYPDGQAVVKKTYGRMDHDSVDSEYLVGLVSEAIGAPTPAVVRDPGGDPAVVWMQYVPGSLAASQLPRRLTPDPYASDDAALLGLLDVLALNWDRNAGNWKYAPGNRIVGIDHGEAFKLSVPDFPDGSPGIPRQMRDSGFTKLYADRGVMGWSWKDNDLHPDDLEAIRPRLQALRAQFVQAHLGHYHQEMMRRLGELQRRARGTRRRIQ
jgi:hypothetical protein